MNYQTEEGMRNRAARQGLPPMPTALPETAPAPVAKSRLASLPSWVPLAVAIATLIVQQVLLGLRLLPPSEPITIAIVILGVVGSILMALPGLLDQYAAHKERLAAIARGKERE
jgi:hypothetical protein